MIEAYTFGPVNYVGEFRSEVIMPDITGPLLRTARELLAHPKPIAELSNDEKSAICIAAGVEIRSSCHEGKLIFETVPQCGIILDAGKYRVYVREPEKPL